MKRRDARMRALHLVARAALRLHPPLRAKEIVDRVGGWLPTLAGPDQARSAVIALGPSGTCLSRALAVAARLPRAEVVIGVDVWTSIAPTAHAWVEFEGSRIETIDIDPNSPNRAPQFSGAEIARLPATAARWASC